MIYLEAGRGAGGQAYEDETPLFELSSLIQVYREDPQVEIDLLVDFNVAAVAILR